MGSGVFDKFKALVGIEEFDEDDFDEFDNMRDSSNSQKDKQSLVPKKPDFRESRELRDLRDTKEQRKTVSINSEDPDQFKMVLTEPKTIDECPKLVDNLKSKKPVIINLEKIESDAARKIFDFLSGATYALNGNVEKVANNIFIFTPENVDVVMGQDGKNISIYSDNLKSKWR